MFLISKENEQGLTLVEVLAVLVISSLIIVLSGSLIVGAMKNYERTSIETNLRDEADIVMSILLKDLFVLKESEVNSDACPPIDLETQNSSTCDLIVKDDPFTPNIIETITFDGQSVITRKDHYTVSDNDVKISNQQLIYNKQDNSVQVKFTLLHATKNIPTTFENEVSLIDDINEIDEEK